MLAFISNLSRLGDRFGRVNSSDRIGRGSSGSCTCSQIEPPLPSQATPGHVLSCLVRVIFRSQRPWRSVDQAALTTAYSPARAIGWPRNPRLHQRATPTPSPLRNGRFTGPCRHERSALSFGVGHDQHWRYSRRRCGYGRGPDRGGRLDRTTDWRCHWSAGIPPPGIPRRRHRSDHWQRCPRYRHRTVATSRPHCGCRIDRSGPTRVYRCVERTGSSRGSWYALGARVRDRCGHLQRRWNRWARSSGCCVHCWCFGSGCGIGWGCFGSLSRHGTTPSLGSDPTPFGHA